jgi:RNA polymerase-interacting CarD/CdnL/TRCF family regulator
VSKKPDSLEKGDWIVHAYYGIGQITKVVTKAIGEEKARYYRVDARNSTYYVPVKNPVNDRIRPLSSTYKLRKAKKILRSDPEEFPENHNDRRKFIAEVASSSDMDISAQILRDLHYRKREHGLNDYEQKVLESTEKIFVREWAIIQGIAEEEALEKLQDIYKEVQE